MVEEPSGTKEKKPLKELAKLDGVWKIVTIEANGKKATPKEVAKFHQWLRVLIEDGTVEINRSEGWLKFKSKGKDCYCDFTLVPGNKQGIDLFFPYWKMPEVRGIYKLEGDTLVLCLPHGNVTDRPTSFTTEAGTSTTRVLLVLQRQKK